MVFMTGFSQYNPLEKKTVPLPYCKECPYKTKMIATPFAKLIISLSSELSIQSPFQLLVAYVRTETGMRNRKSVCLARVSRIPFFIL